MSGSVYQPNTLYYVLSTVLYYTFIAGMLLYFGGSYIANTLNIQFINNLVNLMKQNQSYTMVILVLCNILSSQLMSTGAFEVYFNDELIHSKIQTHDVPDIQYLGQQLIQYINKYK